METYGLEQYGITGIKEVVYNRALQASHASWEAGLLSFLNSSEVHHTVSLEFSSITMNLSLGERPG